MAPVAAVVDGQAGGSGYLYGHFEATRAGAGKGSRAGAGAGHESNGFDVTDSSWAPVAALVDLSTHQVEKELRSPTTTSTSTATRPHGAHLLLGATLNQLMSPSSPLARHEAASVLVELFQAPSPDPEVKTFFLSV